MSVVKKNLGLHPHVRIPKLYKGATVFFYFYFYFFKGYSLKYLRGTAYIWKNWQFLKIQGCGRVTAHYLVNLAVPSE